MLLLQGFALQQFFLLVHQPVARKPGNLPVH
jgi:hypothetical protein